MIEKKLEKGKKKSLLIIRLWRSAFERISDSKIKRQSYLKLDQKKSGDLKTIALLNRVKSRPFYRIMAPFKLFRISGSTSRSTSQENEPDHQPPSNLVVTSSFNKLTTAITSSSVHNNYLNIDESDQTSENSSIMSLNNDQRALLSAGSTADQIGKIFPSFLVDLDSSCSLIIFSY